MSRSSQECRRQALACVRRAESTSSPEDRRTFAKLAEIWLKLAGDLEELDTRLLSKDAWKKTG
jgi:hypothetical protein